MKNLKDNPDIVTLSDFKHQATADAIAIMILPVLLHDMMARVDHFFLILGITIICLWAWFYSLFSVAICLSVIFRKHNKLAELEVKKSAGIFPIAGRLSYLGGEGIILFLTGMYGKNGRKRVLIFFVFYMLGFLVWLFTKD